MNTVGFNDLRRHLDSFHRFCGRSAFVTRFAVKLRNQCSAIVAASLTDGTDMSRNGEHWLVGRMKGTIRRFVDVGANVGDWSAFVLEWEPDAAGICFEPAPSVGAVLCRRAAAWAKVRVIAKAVSDHDGTMIFLDRGEGSSTSGEASVVGTDNSEGGVVEVPVVTLEAELTRLGWDGMDLLKVDVEGLDWRVLKGAGALVREQRIRVIQFEYGEFWMNSGGTLHATARWLERNGYSVWRLRGRGLSPLNLEVYGEHFSYSNLVAIRCGEEAAFLV